jgi:two-component system chemotaxis sensor kinase CheA
MEEMDEIVQEFLVESHENLDQLDRDLVGLEQDPGSPDLLASIFRTIHTIKGTSGFLAFGNLEAVTHVGENLLARLRDGHLSMTPATTDVLLQLVDTVRELLAAIEATGTEGSVPVRSVVDLVSAVLDGEQPAAPVPAAVEQPSEEHPPVEDGTARRSVAEASIRVDVEVLDTLMRLVGELVLTRNQIVRQASGLQDQGLVRSAQRLSLVATELQEGVMRTRMQPIDHLWSKLPRLVRDLGAQCGKQVRLAMVGRETELDRTLLEAVKDPLTHLVRNAVDHGLERPDDRVAAGKPAEGLLTLRAYHEGGQVVVEVCDDGAGIDAARIAAKAVDEGLREAAQLSLMSQSDILQLIFAPGLSTAAAVTNVSGRGVGMDVVRTNVESIGGTIEVESAVGRGTTCRLRIPLTLAIVPALIVECAGDRYAIPQLNLLELVALDADRAESAVEDVNGAPVYRLRGSLLPLVRLADVLGVESDRSDGGVLIAVLQADGRRFGLVIDRVLTTEEIVVEPLATTLRSLGTYSGATILGDGRVALILDVQGLARGALSGEVVDRRSADERAEPAASHARTEDRVLLAGIGDGRQVAIPLASVTRLEHLPAASVERVGHREAVQYRGAVLPLLRLDEHLGSRIDRGTDDLVVVVHSAEGRSIAIVVDEIVDVVDVVDVVEGGAQARSDIDGGPDQGLVGSAVVRDRIVELLDVRAAVLAADPRFYSAPRADRSAAFLEEAR